MGPFYWRGSRDQSRGRKKHHIIQSRRRQIRSEPRQREQAQRGLVLHRFNLEYKREWDGQYYDMQQIAAVVAEEPDWIVVVTVYTFYF